MTAVNAVCEKNGSKNLGVHELTGVRLPLQPYSGGHAVFMYSTASDGNVTLQLKEPDDLDRNSLAAMLARLQDDATFSISYQDTDILSDGSIDVLLGTGTANSGGSDAVTATFDLFDSSSGPDLTLSPQTFTNSAEAFINDNSNSLGVPADSDAVSTTTADDKKPGSTSELVKVSAKRSRPKPTSPNRQGPQQCQVCAKVFGNASALAKHKLTHSDERKYVCSMCGKAFKRQDHLNGHMLTHRNKKPYECKAEGCGKSYCDARSLRRHTENHHSSSTVNTTSTTMSPAQGAASGDAASPHGSSCIQYAPPPTSTTTSSASTSGGGKSQLQQLLATDPAKGGSGGNNDGLTKQQLDLIHQIMEQTQRQSQAVSGKPATKPAAKANGKTSSKAQSKAGWSSGAGQQQQGSSNKTIANGAPSPQSKVSTTTPSTSPVNSTTGKPEQKPVECNLCHRKFKNIPALNGHMRLHGGYFKKDSENKKCEKKDPTGPPLQTASVSVRALIEEKIINKRITNPPASSTTQEDSKSNAPPLFPLTVHSSGNADLESKISSFVVPAPPQQTTEKARRHSDAEAFRSSTQQEAQALADLILKREKASVKRTTSDPGQSQSQSSPLIEFQSADSFTLANVTYQSEEAEFISSTLQDEVFTQVQDTMLLQGVDPNQLASIQFQTDSLLQDQNDQQLQEFKLEDINLQESVVQQSPSYQSSHSVNQELQAVLDSPLPESLAEFSTFHSTSNLDMPSPGYQTHSPAQYARSPHTITAQSPLQSPLIRHDSPGFAYPTPPASHEGQSPGFGQSTILPMVSPTTQEFGQIVERGMYDPPQASSPLSAAFFTSTMSSSAAVEEALEEVLPGESIYPLTNSPTPQSPLGLTPVPSPISSIVTSSDPSPHPSTTFSPSPNTSTFSMGNNWCNGVMLPNSDDPLLSSSPKDFVTKKKFEFNGVPLRLISNNGLLELNSTNFAGILVDANGEIKLIQTGGNTFQKNFVLTNTQIVTQEAGCDDKNKVQKVIKTVQCAIPTKQIITRPKHVLEVKKEDSNDVFLSPTTIPASPVRTSRKRPRTEPLQLPVLHQSKLRATRSKPQGSAPYTPQPILNPQRPGTGLYSNLKGKNDEGVSWSNEPIPETDSTPHVNIGAQFQCNIPPFTSAPNRGNPEPTYEDLLWDPGINNCTDSEVDMYLDFACCAAVPGGGRNKEYAMHLLHMCGGNIHDAMLRLMQPSPHLPTDHPLLAYQYSESDKWSSMETDIFHKALLKYDKDFRSIAQEIRTKSVKQCVQFYYVWKKVCADEYRRLKQVRERRNSYLRGSDSDMDEKLYPDAKLLGIADSGSPMPVPETRGFVCEFPDCSASFNSRAALNGHIRIHGGTARNSPTPATSSAATDRKTAPASSTVCHPDSTDEYPCKICGKVFTKIKSRSAHMKSHRPPDAEPVKRKEKDPPSCPSYELSVPSPFST